MTWTAVPQMSGGAEAKTEIDGDVTDGELTAAKQDLKAREMRTRGRIRTSRRERERTSTRM